MKNNNWRWRFCSENPLFLGVKKSWNVEKERSTSQLVIGVELTYGCWVLYLALVPGSIPSQNYIKRLKQGFCWKRICLCCQMESERTVSLRTDVVSRHDPARRTKMWRRAVLVNTILIACTLQQKKKQYMFNYVELAPPSRSILLRICLCTGKIALRWWGEVSTSSQVELTLLWN